MVLLFAILSLLTHLALAQDPNLPVFPSNTSSYVPNTTNTTQQLLLNLPTGITAPFVFALTDAASSLPPRDPGTTQGVGDHLWNANPQTSANISVPARAIAYISCDQQSYVGNIGLSDVLDNAISANVSAVLFYSVNDNFCLLNTTLSQRQRDFGRYFTMVAATDSIRIANTLPAMLTGNFGAEIMTQAAYNNVMNAAQNSSGIDSTPSTAVAMIILYSITGVITALFLVIIITGAVRAHRHPERYGPQNMLGRARQSRAKGIARAMLDTIPIVKFGEKQPPKTTDVEMGHTSPEATRDAHAQSNSIEKNENSAGGESSSANATGDGTTAAAATDSPHGDAGPNVENVTCSICTEDFGKGEDVRVLPCDHKFHPSCVDPWLLDVSGTCPLCRVDLRPKEEQPAEGSEQQEGQGQSSGEGAPLPPPLGQGRNRRRDTILHFLDRRRLQDSNPEERISALRRWRHATRRSHTPPQENAGESGAQSHESSTAEEQR